MEPPNTAAAERLAKLFSSHVKSFRTPERTVEIQTSGLLGRFKCTGRLVACDPHGIASARAFERVVRPGPWGVYALDAKVGKTMRRAACWVKPMKGFRQPTQVKRWAPATVEGDPSERASPTRVDSGTFAYCDGASPARYAASSSALAQLLRSMEMPVPGIPHRSSAGAVVGLLPGMGDGQYLSYWGLDDDGILGLLTDFALLS